MTELTAKKRILCWMLVLENDILSIAREKRVEDFPRDCSPEKSPVIRICDLRSGQDINLGGEADDGRSGKDGRHREICAAT